MGDFVISKESSLYLDGFLYDNGSTRPELSRRVRDVRAEFETLCRVWNHAVLVKAEKVQKFFNLRTFENVVVFAHNMVKQSRTDKTRCFPSKMSQDFFFLLAPS